jgi:YggT family protein
MGPSLVSVLVQFIGLYQMLIFVYVILSWIQGSNSSVASIYRALGTVCEPFVGIFRRLLPSSISGGSGLDFSPLIAMFALSALQRLVGMVF